MCFRPRATVSTHYRFPRRVLTVVLELTRQLEFFPSQKSAMITQPGIVQRLPPTCTRYSSHWAFRSHQRVRVTCCCRTTTEVKRTTRSRILRFSSRTSSIPLCVTKVQSMRVPSTVELILCKTLSTMDYLAG